MGKINDEKRANSNEFKQLLTEDKRNNFIICSSTSSSTSSSIKDSSNSLISNSISASPASTTSHLSEYSSDSKQIETKSINQSSSIKPTNELNLNQKINIKENKLSKENYVLLLNDFDQIKNHSSPSTKSSSINSLNQLIKSSSSVNSTRLPRQINRSLTLIDQNILNQSIFKSHNCNDKSTTLTKQYFKTENRSHLSKSASTQSQNLINYEYNLPQSQSVFNGLDNTRFDNHSNQFNNQYESYQNSDPQSNDDNRLKISFKDSFYKKWFLNKFRHDNELNKNPKLINLKRYSSIDLNGENLVNSKKSNESQSIERQSNLNEKLNDKNNETVPGPSGIQTKKINDKSNNYMKLKSDLKLEQMTKDPLNPFYLNTVNCSDIDTWTVIDNESNTIYHTNLNNETLVCTTNNNKSKKSIDKQQSKEIKSTNQQSNEQSMQNKINFKKPILLPKLHNEYCINTNSSHHHHKNSHLNENSSNCSNGSITTRSSSTNSSNVSTSSSTDDNKVNNNLKPNNDLCGSLSSVSSDMNTDPALPICKICHLNGKDQDPLITPCKCAGTMQFIHCKCLMRWLEISKKKSRKPLSCELCQYQYQWHKKFKVGKLQFPKCSKKDKFLHLAFIVSVIIMIACALSIIIFFKLQEPVYRTDIRRYDLTLNEQTTVGFAMIFVFSFCMSLYAQVKARTTLYRLIKNFIYLNQSWYINEYEKNSSIKEVSGTPEIV